jgi:hypothetical protein
MAQKSSALRARLRRLTNVHFLLIIAFVGQLIIFDAGKLFPPTVVLQRWVASSIFAVLVTIVWYLARNRAGQESTLKKLLATLVMADIALASFAVYTQRGMASRAIALYAIPIIVSSAINRRSAILASATLCMAAYISTCVAYFVLHFNEGYKLELYGETGFYAVLFILLGLTLWSVVKPVDKS